MQDMGWLMTFFLQADVVELSDSTDDVKPQRQVEEKNSAESQTIDWIFYEVSKCFHLKFSAPYIHLNCNVFTQYTASHTYHTVLLYGEAAPYLVYVFLSSLLKAHSFVPSFT